MSKAIHAGQTYTVGRTLDLIGTLAIQGGIYGGDGGVGIISSSGVLINRGDIGVAGGVGDQVGGTYHNQGASLMVDGKLTNLGTLVLSDGAAGDPAIYRGELGGLGGMGGTLDVVGLLHNAGTVQVDGGVGGRSGGLNAQASVEGVLSNSGLLDLEGGGYGTYRYAIGEGSTLFDSGVLTNTGVIDIDGGVAHSLYAHGATLTVAGSLTNTGTIAVSGGGFGANYHPGGGVLLVEGRLDNAGLITLSGEQGLSPAQLIVDGVLINTGTIQSTPDFYRYVKVFGTIEMSGSAAITGGTMFNYGLIEGSGVISSNWLDGDGTLIASGGVLSVTGLARGDHNYEVRTGATLYLHATAYSNYGGITLNAGGVLQAPIEPYGYAGGASALGVAISSPHGGTFELLGGGTGTLNPVDTRLTISLAQASTLTLSKMGFVTAIGSAGNDKITALAAGQTLTGGLGADLLVGASATGDTFLDTAAGLNGDAISHFAGTDAIDVTDLAPGADLSLTYQQGDGNGKLTLSESGTSATITLLGSFTQNEFSTKTDGHDGVLIGLQSGG